MTFRGKLKKQIPSMLDHSAGPSPRINTIFMRSEVTLRQKTACQLSAPSERDFTPPNAAENIDHPIRWRWKSTARFGLALNGSLFTVHSSRLSGPFSQRAGNRLKWNRKGAPAAAKLLTLDSGARNLKKKMDQSSERFLGVRTVKTRTSEYLIWIDSQKSQPVLKQSNNRS